MKYVLFLVESPFVGAVYNELYRDDNVLIYRRINNRILNRIRGIHTSVRINKHFRLPLQGVWKHTFFDEKKLDKYDDVIFLFVEGNKQAYDERYLSYIRKKYKKAKLFFYFCNPADCIGKKTIDFINRNYDKIVSFNPLDCKKYDWYHYDGIYSKPRDNSSNEKPKIDIFFVGNDKGRLENIRKIYKRLVAAGLQCIFYVSDVGKEECIDDGICYNQYLKYEDVIDYVKRSKAVLELLQVGQNGSTMRTMEALVYEKLLITNNTSVRKEWYYDKKQFYVFNDCDRINALEIKSIIESAPSFRYDGRLSPYRLLGFLEQLYKND